MQLDTFFAVESSEIHLLNELNSNKTGWVPLWGLPSLFFYKSYLEACSILYTDTISRNITRINGSPATMDTV